MTYKIEYSGGHCKNYAHSREDLLEWLTVLEDEIISDIRKIHKDGTSTSVLERYKKYIKAGNRK
ncbi:MAG: hypothetical protein PHQ72_14190 [Hespellia sp.]|nr:hypothetical protein [Hespellia sp.]